MVTINFVISNISNEKVVDKFFWRGDKFLTFLYNVLKLFNYLLKIINEYCIKMYIHMYIVYVM